VRPSTLHSMFTQVPNNNGGPGRVHRDEQNAATFQSQAWRVRGPRPIQAAPRVMTTEVLQGILAAIEDGSVSDRSALLRHVTDLFIVGSGEHSEGDLSLFDIVFSELVVEIETAARAFLATRLAPVKSAPSKIVRTLAFDDEVDVAAPILSQSERLDDASLVENASQKSQEHLFAISRRKSLSTAVTDVLVHRGDAQVVLSTAENRGARFSDSGFASLVQRADGDDRLAASVGSREDIPWQLFTKLLAKASDHVRARLIAEHPHAQAEIGRTIDEIAGRIAEKHVVAAAAGSDLHTSLDAMLRSGELDDEQIRWFAQDGLVEHVKLALGLISQLPAAFIQQALAQDSGETLVVLARAHGLSWSTVKGILQLAGGQRSRTQSEIRQCLAYFEKLNRVTAAEITQFYKARGGPAGK
jgi:uncharacterized protein (DUF2336 family)